MSEEHEVTLPKVGLTKLQPVLKIYGVGRAGHKAGVNAGIFPPARVPSRKPGSPDFYDCAQVWAVVEGKDWRQVNFARVQTYDAE